MEHLIKRIIKEETELPLYVRRRVSMEELDDLVLNVKDLIDSNYDKTDAIYDTVRQFVTTKKEFKFNDETEQGYWDSYIEVEEPLVNYVKTNLHESKRRILREETEGSVFTPMEIKLFKFTNRFKKELGTLSKMIEFFRNSLRTFNIPENEARKYYDIYTLNYRPEGDYENVTISNFKDPKRYTIQKKTSNVNSKDFTKDKLPFKGSNLEGYWHTSPDNEWTYVVKSYGWYPIYAFKYNRWFEVDNTYSSSTSKQMRHANPIRYNENLGEKSIIVDQNEMDRIIRGQLKPEDLLSTRTDKFITEMKQKQRSGEIITFRAGWWNERVRIKVKISSVRKTRTGYDISVDVLDVDKLDGNKLDREAGNFFNNEMEGITKEKILKDVEIYFAELSSRLFKGLKTDPYKIKTTFKGQ